MSVRDIVELSCKELVELVTDYQCDALAPADRATFEKHVFGCTWCMTYLKQVDRAVELTAQLKPPAEAAPVDPGKLGALFRGWRRGQGGDLP